VAPGAAVSVTGDLAGLGGALGGLGVPWSGWPVAMGDGRELYRLPGGDGGKGAAWWTPG
jgi:hypothetical protein